MSLLSVTVKKARYIAIQGQQYNTYVTLKLQNVKTTTVTVKGLNPCWEQDFLFETNDVNTGLLIEVWNKGMLWDKAIGYHWLPLPSVHYSNEEGPGEWVSLDAELVMMEGMVVGTKEPTGHSLLVDCRFELPFDGDGAEGVELQRKLEMLNNIMDQEARAEQARRQMQYFAQSGYSEDSDYTSDLNYPLGGQQSNSSASQFRGLAHSLPTPQRSLETSRENSYETEDNQHQPHLPSTHLSPGQGSHIKRRGHKDEEYYGAKEDGRRYIEQEQDPLYYNSRPRNHKEPYSSYWYGESSEYPGSERLSSSKHTNYRDQPFYNASPTAKKKAGVRTRRPSLERQTTLYDDQYYSDSYYKSRQGDQHNYSKTNSRCFNQSCEFSPEYYDQRTNYTYRDERYGGEEEDRQWDSGGSSYRYQKQYKQPGSTNRDHYENQINSKYTSNYYSTGSQEIYYSARQSYEDEDYQEDFSSKSGKRSAYGSKTDVRSEGRKQRLEHPDWPGFRPRKNNKPKLLPTVPPTRIKPSPSLPPTPNRGAGRKLPTRRTSSLEHEYNDPTLTDSFYASYYGGSDQTFQQKNTYNEDYNYAYESTDNLTPVQVEPSQVVENDKRTHNSSSNKRVNQGYAQEYVEPKVIEKRREEEPPSKKRDRDEATLNRRDTLKKQYQSRMQGSYNQNSSLDMPDDALRDSFETAVSSISCTVNRSSYEMAGERMDSFESERAIGVPVIREQASASPTPPAIATPVKPAQSILPAALNYQQQNQQHNQQNQGYQQNQTYQEPNKSYFQQNQTYKQNQTYQEQNKSYQQQNHGYQQNQTFQDQSKTYQQQNHGYQQNQTYTESNTVYQQNQSYQEPNKTYQQNHSIFDQNKPYQQNQSYNDQASAYQDQTSAYQDQASAYQDQASTYQDQASTYQDQNESYLEDQTYQEKNSTYQSDLTFQDQKTYQEENGTYQQNQSSFPDQNKTYQEPEDSYQQETESYQNSYQKEKDNYQQPSAFHPTSAFSTPFPKSPSVQAEPKEAEPEPTPVSTFPSRATFLPHQQESVDSYAEEVADDYSRDSPASVVDRYEPQPVDDAYEPQTEDVYEPNEDDRYELSTYEPQVPSDDYYPPSPPPRASPLPEIVQVQVEVEPQAVPRSPEKQKSVSFEDDEQQQPPEPPREGQTAHMSAKDRWHWAYNKIMNQLTRENGNWRDL